MRALRLCGHGPRCRAGRERSHRRPRSQRNDQVLSAARPRRRWSGRSSWSGMGSLTAGRLSGTPSRIRQCGVVGQQQGDELRQVRVLRQGQPRGGFAGTGDQRAGRRRVDERRRQLHARTRHPGDAHALRDRGGRTRTQRRSGVRPQLVLCASPGARTRRWYYAWVLRIADGADLMANTTHKVRFLTGAHNIDPQPTDGRESRGQYAGDRSPHLHRGGA